MIKLKSLFENKILKGEVYIISQRKKVGDKMYKLFFIKNKDGEILGRKFGYDNKEDAVRAIFSLKDNNFLKKSTMKQKDIIDKYIKAHKL